MFSEISYNTKFKLLFPLFRDRLEDMRFMYETVAETAGHISFDSVDPFYDSLPWFRLIGRYVSTLNIKVDHDLSLLSPRPLYLSFYFNFLSGTRSIFSPFGLVTFHPPPPPCSCSTFPFSAFLHLLHFCVISSSPASCRTPFHPAVCTGRSFLSHCILPLRFAPFVRFRFKIFKFCYFSLVFLLFFNCCGYYFFLFFAFKLN